MHKPATGRTLTTGEAAALIGVTSSAVRKAAAEGRLKAARKLPGATGPYLFRRADVDRYIAKRGAL